MAEIKPPAIDFEDVLKRIHDAVKTDHEEHANLPKKFKEGEGITQVVEDIPHTPPK